MAYHTYDFLKKRKDDPKWRDAYLIAHTDRLISLYRTTFLFLLIANALVWFFALTK